jgi:transcriptional regulator with PAS, ATPase and Fis domain
MAAFSQTLFEGSFFGHEKGSFTGADVEKKGLFEAAQGGTLFLDEITELQISLQAKLLRAIQEREFFRVGGTKGKKFDVRFIASTNRDIEEAIQNKSFREDLFYRLNMFHIHIPPLRKRKRDIIPLTEHFLKIHTEKNNKSIDTISPDLIAKLTLYAFPGNVRELESIIAKAVIAERTKTLNLSSAHNLLESIELDKQKTQVGKFLTLGELEKNHINSVLRSTQGNRTQAAKILGISVRTLQRKIIAYNIK